MWRSIAALAIIAGIIAIGTGPTTPTFGQPGPQPVAAPVRGLDFSVPPIAGAGGEFKPLPGQDWSQFPWVAAARQRPSAGPAQPAGVNTLIYRGAEFAEVARYSIGAGSAGPGGLPIDGRRLGNDEGQIIFVGGYLIGAVNRSNLDYVLNLRAQLLAAGAVPWALVGPTGAIIERGNDAPTEAGFCGQLRMGTACLWFDGKMQVLQVGDLS
jgi:hypothetical protein